MYLNKLIKWSGFSLIELMVALVILGILSSIGVISYNLYIKRSNRDLAKQVLLENVAKMETYYAEHGSYLNNGLWPSAILDGVVNSWSGPVYSIEFYPNAATSNNQQAYCMRAIANLGSVQSGESTIYVDRYGVIGYSVPTDCNLSDGSVCSASASSYPACNGNCQNGIFSFCSGNCTNITVCGGGGGCSGSCKNSIIYGSCSGNCTNDTIYGSCSGNCKGSVCCVGGACSACQ